MMAAARRVHMAYYRWMLGVLMIFYGCLLFAILPVKNINDVQTNNNGPPSMGVEHHLEGFKKKLSPSSSSSSLRKSPPSLLQKTTAGKVYGKPPNIQEAIPVEASSHAVVVATPIGSAPQPTIARRKLQEKLDEIYLETGRSFDGDLWELSDYIPPWMKDYFAWHREERKKLTQENWESLQTTTTTTTTTTTRVMVMQCLKGFDDKCGGTADRLKPFLFLLREAHASKRLLLIHWTLPAPLEEFLLPPMNGLDWRVPTWFSEILHDRAYQPARMLFKQRTMKGARGDNKTALFRTRIQSVTGGAEYYDEDLVPGEPNFDDVYHDVWRVFFTPSAPVRATIESYMEKWNLSPGEYAAAHLRALYGRVVERTDEQATEWTQGAINCASALRPGGPFMFASDHSFSTQAALDYGKDRHTKVVSRTHESVPLHIDNAENILERKPSEFYDVFIDLYLMGMSRCLTYNRGGFGQWALLIGYNSSCFHNQKTSVAGIGAPCNWTQPEIPPTDRKASKAPLFVPPMVDTVAETSKRRKLTSFSRQELPVWMTEYFSWHHETRSNLNETNWNQTKYLIMACEKGWESCGGISDRLKPLPFVVLQAARHKRLLFIDWQKPKALQEFLVPPHGGVDWRVPTWMRNHLRSLGGDVSCGCDDLNRKSYIKAEDPAIRLKLQTADAGEPLYASQPDSYSTYGDVFHGLFRAFFAPVPRLQATIDQKMKEHDLVPGEYAAVHLRNMYGKRMWRHPNETIALAVNGINCASTILPGAQIYYAADDKFAVEAAKEYGRQRSLPVGSLDFQDDPIHIDKDDEWQTRNPAVYDDTFLDLFMLGQARCVAYSNGGYGTFGSLLSYDSSCSIRYFRGRKTPRNCTWTDANRKKRPLDPPEMKVPPEMYIAPT